MKADAPSATAEFVAHGVLHVSLHPRLKCEVPADMAEINRRIVTACAGTRGEGLLGERLRLWKAGFLQRMSIPGFYLHFVLRKRHIESQVREAIGDGARQVVTLGSGLDSLAFRLATEFPEVRFIEVDHPSTQQLKRAGLGQFEQPPNLCFQELDHSRQGLREMLAACANYDETAATVFVAEGLFMYLTKSEVENILNVFHGQTGSGSRMIFTFMDEWSPGNFQFRNAGPLVNFWLRWKGEDFTWGVPMGEVSTFLGQRGFELHKLVTSGDLAATLLTGENRNAALAAGECVATAVRR